MEKASEFLKQFLGKKVENSPSAFMNWLNPVMVAVESESLTFQYTVRKEMTNPFGILHGGVTAAMIDDAVGATFISMGEPYYHITVNLAVDYFASAREGDVITATSTVIKKGKQIVNAQCEIWNEDHTKLIARGYTNLIKTEIK
ncbi:PaaI family thioesterase [Flavobacterium beibuense]|uniref:Thioesterase superfamily protein n=1 Tax=Flavobacterium beibuense TaxID=657326 RepID=A0A444W653_9FLAO|nr:PaaI family thioesterase [Flavobacterium beibuense]RYJ41349.1 Thioesterase superfamily protein [Flavobacterium beibuense]